MPGAMMINPGQKGTNWHALGVGVALLLAAFSAVMTWGSTTAQIADHARRIELIEARDISGIASDKMVLQRLTALETKIDILIGRRPMSAERVMNMSRARL